MHRRSHSARKTILVLCLIAGFAPASAQPEVLPSGNITGIRVDGHLLALNSSLCVTEPDAAHLWRTGRVRQSNGYARNGKAESVEVRMRMPRDFAPQGSEFAVGASETITDTGRGAARIGVEFWAPEPAPVGGAHLCLELPAAIFSTGTAELIDPAPSAPSQVSLAPRAAERNDYLKAEARGIRFVSPERQIEIRSSEPFKIWIRDDRRKGNFDLDVLLTVAEGGLVPGKRASKTFDIQVAGAVDRSPVEIALDAAHPGQLFDGFGGNFRLQSPAGDPQVIDYMLQNTRVAWGRVEMPWQLWQPDESADPLAAARAGNLNPRVTQAMEMARRLARKGMPVIVSAWFPPRWAILGPTAADLTPAAPRPGSGGVERLSEFPLRGAEPPRGNPLNPEKMERILRSIADYLVFLKEHYGVEAALFSFNESDLGIDIRQTPREHAELIRTLGAHLARRGLSTKLALGDTSDANPVDFIRPAMQDPEAVRYIGAVDFHSWRGCTDAKLAQWRDAARELNLPLIVGEGSTDAGAWRYPGIFVEPWFALNEITLYTRILAVAQPRSILQWQLTSDYSPLAGGGIYGDNSPLRPTQRFWNLKQLASTPERSFALPATCGKPEIACAALGNIADGVYTLHIVNNGGARPAIVSGLPAGIKELRAWVTDRGRGMQELPRIPVKDGRAQLTLDATSYLSLVGSLPAQK
jgi:hypothetical protein